MEKNIQHQIRVRAALISLFIGFLMFVMKMTAYLLTNSAAIFSDAIESIVHIAATAMAFFSIMLSNQPPDKTHPYGHGKIEFFSAGIEGLLIVLAAIFIIYNAAHDLIFGIELAKLDIGIIIISFAGIVNLFLGIYLVKVGKNTNSLTLVADGKHVLTDSVTSIGAIVGIGLVLLTDIEYFDPAFAIFLGANIIFTGYKLLRESFAGLMNESDDSILVKISEVFIANRKDEWIDIHRMRCWKSGDQHFIDFHITVPFYYTVKETHRIETEIEEILKNSVSNVEAKSHFDFCYEDLCSICGVANCIERKEEQKRFNTWTKEHLIRMTGE